jgi:hypothetical protein
VSAGFIAFLVGAGLATIALGIRLGTIQGKARRLAAAENPPTFASRTMQSIATDLALILFWVTLGILGLVQWSWVCVVIVWVVIFQVVITWLRARQYRRK